MSWGPGTLILNRYRLESLLGRGGMGSVWRAEHVQLKSPVAVKLLDPVIAKDEQMLGRFLREAQAAASLRSPHVVQIFDYGVEDGTAFIAMEMLHGQSLSDRIAQQGKMSPEESFRFLQQVLRAISKAHEAGIVHRDLKPDNIFICQDEPEFAKVLDFGVAKIKNPELGSSGGSRTQTGMMIGTPYYMSPEQTQAKDVDARADLWAIGVIAYECLTGTRPFTGDSFGELVICINTKPVPVPSRVAPVPLGFDEWFVKATQRDRERRFASAREMADELGRVGGMAGAAARAHVLRTQPTPAVALGPRPESTPQVSTPPAHDDLRLSTGSRSATARSVVAGSQRSPLVLGLIAAATLIVVGAGGFVALGGPKAWLRGGDAGAPASVAAVLPVPAPQVAPPVTASVAALPSSSAPVAAASASSVGVAGAERVSPPSTSKPGPKAGSERAEPKDASPRRPASPAAPPKDWNF